MNGHVRSNCVSVKKALDVGRGIRRNYDNSGPSGPAAASEFAVKSALSLQ